MTDEQFRVLLAELRAIRTLLERQRFRRVMVSDSARELLQALAGIAPGLMFTSGEIVGHAAIDASLRALLEACCQPVSTRRVGRFLKRIEGLDLDGYRIERIGDAREGALWAVRVSTGTASRKVAPVIA
jgi:hypothetical protein